MDVTKGFIFNRGIAQLGKQKKHAYLVGVIILTDDPLEDLSPTGETIVAGVGNFAETINNLNKFKPPYPLGDASSAFTSLGDMNVTNDENSRLPPLEKIN